MNQITKIAWDLNEKTENRYQLVYDLIEIAKRLVDESQIKKNNDDFGYDFETSYDVNIKKEKPVQHEIMVKASESDDSGLVGQFIRIFGLENTLNFIKEQTAGFTTQLAVILGSGLGGYTHAI